MKKILLLATALYSCKTVNLGKKDDKVCKACYDYIVNYCPNISNPDTAKSEVVVSIAGVSISDTIYLPSICDSLNRSLIKDKVLIDKKKNGTRITVKIGKNGNLQADCITNSIYIKKTVYVPCNCVFTSKDLYNYSKSKIEHAFKKLMWAIVFSGLLIVAIIAYFVKRIFFS